MGGEAAAAEGGSIVANAAAEAAAAAGGEAGGEGGAGGEGDAAAAEKAAADKVVADKAAADAAAAAKGGEGAAEGEGGKEGDAGKTGAPDSYAEFTAPEGTEAIDSLLVDAAAPLFKEQGLSQEQAQGMIEAYQKVREAEAEGFVKQREQADKDLRTELGTEYEPTQNRIGGMLARFSKEVGAEVTAEVSKLLHDDFGIGDNPALIKLLDFAAKGLSIEDRVSGEGGQQGKGEKLSDADAAKSLYGDSMYNEDGSLKNP